MTPAQLFDWLNFKPATVPVEPEPEEPDEPTGDLAALTARVAALEERVNRHLKD